MHNNSSSYRYMALVWASALLPACGSNHESTGPASSMGSALSAVKAAVGACAEQRDACEGAADAGNETCQDAFQACRAQAIAAAEPDLTKGVSACAKQSKTCRKAAPDGGDADVCREQLKQCVADSSEPEAKPDTSAGDADAGAKADHESPMASCTSALRTCIEGDEPAKTCTEQLRACLTANLPEHGQGHGDAGKADSEHGGSGGSSADHKPAEAGVPGAKDGDDGADEASDQDGDADEAADQDGGSDESAEQDDESDEAADGGRRGSPKK